MCGICGDIRTPFAGPVSAEILAGMNAAQRHRGPDDEGIWVRGAVGLGHQRLSILDLSGGRQPMEDPSGRVVVTYNGEIYNYLELKETLRGKGHRFHGTSDTEVLIHAYLEWGTELLNRMAGMFSFGLYDSAQGTLFAARDPYGQKPFFYSIDSQGFLFASELTALLRHPRVCRQLDPEAVARYLVVENFPAPESPFQGVRKLPAGHALLYAPADGGVRIWRYWDPVGEPPAPSDRPPTDEEEEAFVDQLRGSVERHLRSDVPVGVYLSAGVDSTAIAALACEIVGGRNLPTFTVQQWERTFDESALARATAHRLGTQHHELKLTPERCGMTIPGAVDRLDEPLADPGFLSVFQAASLASQQVKVVLSGDGGDELLYGYEPFKVCSMAESLHRWMPAWSKRLSKAFLDRAPAQYGYMGLGYRAQHFVRGLDVPFPVRNTFWIGAFTPSEAQEILLCGEDLESFRNLLRPVYEIHRRAARFDPIARLGLEYQQTYLSNCICPHTDKANMLFSLEARSPFLDPSVVRAANVLPTFWKLHRGIGKWILRRWITRRLGVSLPIRKRGFTVPIAAWLRKDLRSFAQAHLNREGIEAAGLFRWSVVQRLWQEHQTGGANHAKKLWTLLVFQAWFSRQMWGRQAAPLPIGRLAVGQPVHA